MSGGAWEYVMANYNNMAANSGFSEPLTLDSKYYNLYTTGDPSTACNGEECKGHGLSETSGWYSDYHNMVNETYPWLLRGGSYDDDSGAGVFGFSYTSLTGSASTYFSFRLVMSPSP